MGASEATYRRFYVLKKPSLISIFKGKLTEQAGAEPGQAQPQLMLGLTSAVLDCSEPFWDWEAAQKVL